MNIILSILISLAVVGGSMLLPNQYGGGSGDFLGATNFPTSLDSLVNPTATDRTNVVSHADQHSNANDAIEALQAKVGVNGSAVTTSHDYKLSGVTGSDKAVSLTGTEVLTNKALTSPTITSAVINSSTFSTSSMATTTLTGSTTINGQFALNLGSDATGDVYYRASNGKITRLGIGTNGQFLTASSTGLPQWTSQSAVTPVGAVNATSTASTTIAMSADGTDFFQVFVYGTGLNTTGATPSTVTLKLGADSLDASTWTNPNNLEPFGFMLTWFGTPSATTSQFSLTSSNVSSFPDATIIYYKY